MKNSTSHSFVTIVLERTTNIGNEQPIALIPHSKKIIAMATETLKDNTREMRAGVDEFKMK